MAAYLSEASQRAESDAIRIDLGDEIDEKNQNQIKSWVELAEEMGLSYGRSTNRISNPDRGGPFREEWMDVSRIVASEASRGMRDALALI